MKKVQVYLPGQAHPRSRNALLLLLLPLLLFTHYRSHAQDYTPAALAALYQQQQNNPLVKYINTLDQTVRKKNAITGLLTAQDLTRLPIGIMDVSGSIVICIDSLAPLVLPSMPMPPLPCPGKKQNSASALPASPLAQMASPLAAPGWH
jgi:hypothetical protein